MYISEKFAVNSDAERMAAARFATEDFAAKIDLDKRDTLRLDLLVEETLGMVRTMLEDFYGQIWFSADAGNCEIHLEATASMDPEKKEQLLSVASTGKNAAARGFMARLGELISGTMRSWGKTIDTYDQMAIKYGIIQTPVMSGGSDMVMVWTLNTYRSELAQARTDDDAAEDAWDELEKSIVAKLADDIVVGVAGDRIELVIRKQF